MVSYLPNILLISCALFALSDALDAKSNPVFGAFKLTSDTKYHLKTKLLVRGGSESTNPISSEPRNLATSQNAPTGQQEGHNPPTINVELPSAESWATYGPQDEDVNPQQQGSLYPANQEDIYFNPEIPPLAQAVGHDSGHGSGLPHGHMSTAAATLAMVADLCPHGMLPLAFGIAAGGGTGLGTAAGLLAGFAALSAYTLVSLGRAAQATQQATLSGVWAETVGPQSTWVPDGAMALLCYGCCVFYSAFVGDIFGALASAAGLPAALRQRWLVLLALSLFPILPLCLLRDLSALSATNVGGVLAIAYTVGFVIYRSLDGSYQPGGAFHLAMKAALRPDHGAGQPAFFEAGPGTLTLLTMACVAFLCHYNGVGYYVELNRRTVKNYAKVATTGMGVALGVFLLMMTFGFRTFGYAAQALLLNNYHQTEDPLATGARAATGFAILCGYPLMFAGFKAGAFPALAAALGRVRGTQGLRARLRADPKTQNLVSVAALGSITAVAAQCTEEDVGAVIGLIGALLGSFACFIMPAVVNLRVNKLLVRQRGRGLGVGEHLLNRLLVVVGLFLAIFGTYSTVKDGGGHH